MKLPETRTGKARAAAVLAGLIVAYLLIRDHLPSVDVEEVLQDLSESLGKLTYLLVGGLAFLETGAFVGLVAPGETAVILGGAVAGQGEVSVTLMLAIVWFCAWAGDSVSFLLGRKLGRGFILEHGPRFRLTNERFKGVETYFSKHGGKTILIGRFVGIVRAVAPFVAGSSGMRYREMLPYSVLGTGIWGATFTLLGYFASQNINEVLSVAGRATFLLGVLIALVVATILVVRHFRRPDNRQAFVRRAERTRVGRAILSAGRAFTPGGILGLELTSLLAVAAVGGYAFIAYWITVAADPGPTAADSTMLDFVGGIESGALTEVMTAISDIGRRLVLVPVILISALLLARRRHWPELVALLAGAALIQLAYPLVKEIVDRPRPPEPISTLESPAYPSGHATMSVIYSWLALTYTLRVRPRVGGATALIVTGIAITAAIGFSRIYLRAHYFSDVIGGWGLGAAGMGLVAVAVLVVTRLRQNPQADGPASQDRT